MVKADYFELELHQKIFNVVVAYFNDNSSLPSDSIIENEVQTQENKTALEDEFYCINSIELEAIEHKDYYLDTIEKFAKEQAMKLAITESIALLKEGNFGKIDGLVKEALSVGRNTDMGHVYFDGYRDRWREDLDQTKKDLISTPFTEINKFLGGGLERGEIYLAIAPAGIGKSNLLINQGAHSLKEGRKVLHITLEMSESKTAKRYDTILTQLNRTDIDIHIDKAAKSLDFYGNKYGKDSLVIKKFPSHVINANTLRAYITNLKNYRGFKPDVIIIDYLELIRCTDITLPEHKAQEILAHELRNLGFEFSAAVASATQTNREGLNVEIITDKHLADSYGKIRAVDLAFSMNQNSAEKDDSMMRIYMVKVRDGISGSLFRVNMDYNTLIMSDFKKKLVPSMLEKTNEK